MSHIIARAGGGARGVDDAFAELPHELHQRDAAWIPEERDAVAAAFSERNPWFAQGDAATFVIPGRARLAVFRSHECVVEGRPAAFMGYLAQRTPGAAAALWDEAEAWARARGAETLYGPIDFSTLGSYRCRIDEGDEGLPFPGEPYNPPWYDASLRDAGYEPVQRFLSQIGAVDPESLGGKRARRDALLASGYRFEGLDDAHWQRLLPELHRVADDVFGENFAYTPTSYPVFAAACAPLGRRLIPDVSLVARAPDGSLAGFLLVNPHYGRLAVQGAGAERVPVSALSYAEHGQRLIAAGERTAIAKTVGVVKAQRRAGVMDAMGVTAVERAHPRYDRWLAALMRDDNHSTRFGAPYARGTRRYALYAKTLTPPRHATG